MNVGQVTKGIVCHAKKFGLLSARQHHNLEHILSKLVP